MEVNEKMTGIMNETKEKMKKSLNDLAHSLSQIRSGRATPALVEDIKVEVYGQQMPMNQIGSINIPEPRMILIDVWDKSNSQEVLKAIQKSGRNLNPQDDGVAIRIVLPELNEERRKELLKLAKQKVEDHKVSIRNIRRDANENIKKLKNDGLSEDDLHQKQNEIQKLTDENIAHMDEIFKKKETEIMTV
ncbi:MAG: ribosome recycling factor [Spirochaetia bacterium]|nr:ribosome recycling factor [Spirochaetia bacterium]